jgi:hypothetical protein
MASVKVSWAPQITRVYFDSFSCLVRKLPSVRSQFHQITIPKTRMHPNNTRRHR